MNNMDFVLLEWEMDRDAKRLRKEARIDMIKGIAKLTLMAALLALVFIMSWILNDCEASASPIKEDLAGGVKWEQAVPEFTEGEAMELMRVARAEAGNQGAEGQALVMRVILNRVEDGRFGSTIHEVITAPSQFSTVSSGAWLQEPNADSFEALEMVRNGWDESQGALYFRATWSGHFTWAHYLFTWGGHHFYN